MLVDKSYILSLWKTKTNKKAPNLCNKTFHFHWKVGGGNCPAVPNSSGMQWKSLLIPSKCFCVKTLYKQVAHTLWAWLRDYIKLQIILTVQGIVGVKHDKYCFLVTETVMSEGGNTRGPVQWKTQSMQAVALQYTSRTAVFSWAASWLQLQVRAPPIPGSVSWNILETKGLWNERKGVPQFFLTPSSCRVPQGSMEGGKELETSAP